MNGISVTIITRNEEKNILRCLESVKPIAGEIVVVDSLSGDHTADICRSFGCRVFLREFDGYGSQKQFAVDQSQHDWVLSIDADEVLSPELQQEILHLFNSGGPLADGYFLPRSLCFMGRVMKYSGVSKELILRLFNRKKGVFTRVPVHERIEVQGKTDNLKGKILHYSYRDISHHLDKINGYTSHAAQGYLEKGRSFSKSWVALKFPVSFITFYLFKGGFLDGYPGFMWSFFAAVYGSVKIAKTIELKETS